MSHLDIERRITLRLLAYWEKLRKDRPMPAEQDINPDDLEDLWDSCLLIHVKDLKKKDYHYAYLGQSIADAYQAGLCVNEVPGGGAARVLTLADNYARVVTSGKPVIEEGSFRTPDNDIVKYRQCLLPLGSEGQVEAIFGGLRFKIFAAS